MGIDNITSIEVYQTIKPTSRKGQQNDTRKKPATQADKRNKNHKKKIANFTGVYKIYPTFKLKASTTSIESHSLTCKP